MILYPEGTVSAQPLDSRMARLEGAYEQVAERLNGIEQRMSAAAYALHH